MNTKKILLVSIALMAIVLWATAHEFWLQPQQFILKTGEKTNIQILVGENFTGEKWPDTKDKIVKLTHYAVGQTDDFLSFVPSSDPKRLHQVTFDKPGNHLIAFNNKNKFIKLEASKFNEYLQTDGLNEAARLRKERKETQKEGREFYQRCVKTLLQVGDIHDDTYKINTGMMLELIPEKNPYVLTPNQTETFTVLFNSKPLSNALVLVWHHQQGKTTLNKLRSNVKGQIQFKVFPQGRWMISVVHMVPFTQTAEADWQSYWGSYTFGFY
ncbi:MAG: DUF4198 domain-containing protein [Spirosomataceae bacterium]